MKQKKHEISAVFNYFVFLYSHDSEDMESEINQYDENGKEPLSEMDTDNSKGLVNLPTKSDILDEILLKKKDHGKRCTTKVLNEIIRDVSKSLVDKWDQYGIPIVSFENVRRALKRLADEKTPKNLDHVFNIAKCKHPLTAKTIADISKSFCKIFALHAIFEKQ